MLLSRNAPRNVPSNSFVEDFCSGETEVLKECEQIIENVQTIELCDGHLREALALNLCLTFLLFPPPSFLNTTVDAPVIITV